ncbi:hypothetical protein F7734_10250 [Scytonema sp. UIC 10036]|nr:hypothetical protein [Scytonema sp. UIC 10036]
MAERRTKRKSSAGDTGDTKSEGTGKLTLYDFCSGIGLGFLAAATMLGEFDIIGACEIDDYCRSILALRYPGVPIARDIRVREDFERVTATVTSCSLPCQPFSIAGKRLAADDERNLFPYWLERIDTINSRYLVLENVPGILSAPYQPGKPTGTFFRWLLWELSHRGYYVQWQVLGSGHFGSPFPRERLLLVAIAASVVEQFGGNPPTWSEQVRDSVERVGATWSARSSEPGISSERIIQLASELGISIGVPSGNGDIRNQRKAYGNCFDPRVAATALSYVLRVEAARRRVEGGTAA